MNNQPVDYSTAIEAAKRGCRVTRGAWLHQEHWHFGYFLFYQVPCNVPKEVIPKMSSLPKAVKAALSCREADLCYTNQLALVSPNNQITGYSPSGSDAGTKDWFILDEPEGDDELDTVKVKEESETIGTGLPFSPIGENHVKILDALRNNVRF